MRYVAGAAILLLLPSLAVAQEKTVAVPATIKVEGMPPIPQSIADGLARTHGSGARSYRRGIRPSGKC